MPNNAPRAPAVEIEQSSEDEVLAVARAYCEAQKGHAVPDPTIYPTAVREVRALIAAIDALEAF